MIILLRPKQLINSDDIDAAEANARDEMREYVERYASLRWCYRVRSWLELYRSGYLARAMRPPLEQIIASLEREAIEGEILARQLGQGEEREVVLRLVRKLDAIGNELCDLSISRLPGRKAPIGLKRSMDTASGLRAAPTRWMVVLVGLARRFISD
jgi:hypothetical protein